MSSFVVEPKTINRVVTFLYLADGSGSIWASSIKNLIAEHLIDIRDKDGLCLKLFELNVQAVKERYGDEDFSTMPGPKGMRPENYRFKFLHSDHVQVFKSLQCLIYQCSEGNVPETKLYRFLSELENTLARAIVSALPEYDKAEWA